MKKQISITEQTIISSVNYNIMIGVYPRDCHAKGYFKDPYFKIFNSRSEASATKVSRISILRPEYVIHNGKDGKMPFYLSMKEIAFMLKTLKEPIHGYNSAWEYMLEFLIKLAESEKISTPYNTNLPIPDYTLLR